ncbi:unnamed protein product [Prorocentrum cordatum]|uniref:RBR-type E3 ubiquitin transferase n=1 Tax=Prorocentrum cordatum TaxID=2364126 RepID=A0ABN9QN89_9DINO|nr:unnamed protein product [Polarella glacialis]
MALHMHPADWDAAQTQEWLESQCFFPSFAGQELSGQDILSLSEDEARTMAGGQFDQFWQLAERLRKVADDSSLLCALRCQQEDADTIVAGLIADDIEGYLRDSFFAQEFHHSILKQRRVEDNDRLLALKLSEDWANASDQDAHMLNVFAQEEALAAEDANFARCVHELPDGAAYVLTDLKFNGSDQDEQVATGPPGEPRESLLPEVTVPGISAETECTDATEAAQGLDAGGCEVVDRRSVDSKPVSIEEYGEQPDTIQDDTELPPLEDVEMCGCLACLGNFPLEFMVALPCRQHTMCPECFRQLCCSGLRDVSLLPVSCCGVRVPADIVQKVLDTSEFEQYLRLVQEKLAAHKMYCPSCSCFIDLDNLMSLERATEISCPRCSEALCSKCKSGWHPGASCSDQPASPEDVVFEETAAQHGWKRCPGCAYFVSLRLGCNHITCRCGCEFCYACLADWSNNTKTCDCPLWDEQNLLLEEERRQNNREEQLGRPLRRQERLDVRLQLEHDNRVGNECNHRSKQSFVYREFQKARTKSGLRTCDNCSNPITAYAYECQECRMRICSTCMHNRRIA